VSVTERLQILVTADAKGAQRELQAFGRQAERSVATTEGRLQALSGQFESFGASALLAGGVAATGLYSLARAASALQEQQSSANAVLGDEGAAVLEEYAKTAAQSAGVSQRAALQFGSSFGLFVEKAGFVGPAAGQVSSDLVQLAGDISALRDVPIEEALTAVQSALAGETESIRRFGIDVSDATLKQEIFARTGEKVSGTLTQQQKVQEIINQLYEQGSVFAGRFTAETDNLATRQKVLAAEFENTKAAVGEALLPAFESAVGGVQGLLDGFNSLPSGAQQAVGGIAGIATTGALAAGGLALLASGAIRTRDTFREVGTRVRESDGVLGRFSGTLRDTEGNLTRTGQAASTLSRAAAGIGATLAVSDVLFQVFNDGSGVARDFTDAVNELRAAVAQGSEGDAFAAFADAVGAEQNTLRLQNLWQEFGAEIDLVGTGVKADVEQVQRAFDALDPKAAAGALAALEAATAELDPNSRQFAINTEFIERNRASLAKAEEARQAEAAAAEAGTEAATGNTAALTDNADAADALEQSLNELTARQKLVTLGFDVASARADSFASALERSTNIDNLLGSAVGAGRALASLRSTLGMVPDTADSLSGANVKAASATDRLRTAVERSDPSLSQLAINLGAVDAAANAFGAALDDASREGDELGSALAVGDAFGEFSKTFRRLPADIDLASISLGKLRPRTADAVRNVLALGDATGAYLKSLITSGASFDRVRSESARLRGEFEAQFRQLGLTEEQLAEYIRLTGTAPDQIETAIRLAGVEGARFKLNAYLGLLEGRIPPEVATQIIPLIESENLSGAAAVLADFAATNPVEVDVSPTGTRELKEAKGTIEDLPRDFDALKAATGGYNTATLDALDAVMGLGDSYRDFLTEVVRDDPEKAVEYAAKLREQFADTVSQLGLNEEQLNDYYTLLGIAPDQVETAIELANFDATVFQITTVIALLQGIGDLSPEVSLQISDALLREDYEEVKRLLDAQLLIRLDADPAEGKAAIGQWRVDEEGNAVLVPADADTAPANQVLGVWRLNQEGDFVLVPVDAETQEATQSVIEWLGQLPGFNQNPPAQVGVDANMDKATQTVTNWLAQLPGFNLIPGFGQPPAQQPSQSPFPGLGGFNPSQGPNVGRPGRRQGGTVTPGSYLVGEEGPEIVEFGARGTVYDADTTSKMTASLSADRQSVDRMMRDVADYLSTADSGVQIGEMTIVAPEPERAGTEVIRRLRKRRMLGA